MEMIDLEPFTGRRVRAVKEHFRGSMVIPAKDMVTQYCLNVFFDGFPPIGSDRMDLNDAIAMESKFLEAMK